MKNNIIAVILTILASVVTVVTIVALEKYRVNNLYTYELLARAPENGNWYPKILKVSHGKKVKILIRNVETVSHGFALPAFNVGVEEIKAGETVVVEFTADKKGKFPFMCTMWCSDHHMEMKGELIVE